MVMDEAYDEWEYGKNKWIQGRNVGEPGHDGTNLFFKEWAGKGHQRFCAQKSESILDNYGVLEMKSSTPNDPTPLKH